MVGSMSQVVVASRGGNIGIAGIVMCNVVLGSSTGRGCMLGLGLVLGTMSTGSGFIKFGVGIGMRANTELLETHICWNPSVTSQN